MINIRKAELADIDVICKLEKSCFDPKVIEPNELYIERIKLFADGFLIMEENKEVIGVICSELWKENAEDDEKKFAPGHSIIKTHNIKGSALYISSFAIFPKYQGKGYGKLLFNTLIERLTISYPNIKKVKLLVSEDWLSALYIYTEYGFEINKMIPNFFDDKTGIIMEKMLVEK